MTARSTPVPPPVTVTAPKLRCLHGQPASKPMRWPLRQPSNTLGLPTSSSRTRHPRRSTMPSPRHGASTSRSLSRISRPAEELLLRGAAASTTGATATLQRNEPRMEGSPVTSTGSTWRRTTLRPRDAPPSATSPLLSLFSSRRATSTTVPPLLPALATSRRAERRAGTSPLCSAFVRCATRPTFLSGLPRAAVPVVKCPPALRVSALAPLSTRTRCPV